jgi:hypothetical protein
VVKFRTAPANKVAKTVGSWEVVFVMRSSLQCSRIAYQRNDDDEEEAARERRRRARQERLRQKQEEEALGQVTDQVEVNAQNRYWPLCNGESLWCVLACLLDGLCQTKNSLLSPLGHFQSILFILGPFLATNQIEQSDVDIRTLYIHHSRP